jgi:hypothetical protein
MGWYWSWRPSWDGPSLTYHWVEVRLNMTLWYTLSWWGTMLEFSHTFHFDSKIGVHDYSTCDIFSWRIRGALLLLRGVHPGDPTFNELVEKPMLNVPIFTHVGSWECGYVISHNLCQHHKHTFSWFDNGNHAELVISWTFFCTWISCF